MIRDLEYLVRNELALDSVSYSVAGRQDSVVRKELSRLWYETSQPLTQTRNKIASHARTGRNCTVGEEVLFVFRINCCSSYKILSH